MPALTSRFSRMPLQACSDKRLRPLHWRTLCALCSFANKDGKPTFPGQEKLAALIGAPRSKVCTALANLRRWGYFTTTKRRGRLGRFASTYYLIRYEAPTTFLMAADHVTPGGVTDHVTPGGVTDHVTPGGGRNSP